MNRKKASWQGTNPHDKLVLLAGCKEAFLKGDLLHYSIDSISQHIQTVDKFSQIAAEAKFKKGEKASFIKIILHPAWKFFRNYVLKLGFLDGYYGFVITTISAHATFLRYVKLRELNKKQQQ